MRDRRPSRATPSFSVGALGVEPEYTLTYTTADGDQRRVLPRTGVESFGKLLSSLAGRGEAWDIAVTDEAGADVVCNFRCFAG